VGCMQATRDGRPSLKTLKGRQKDSADRDKSYTCDLRCLVFAVIVVVKRQQQQRRCKSDVMTPTPPDLVLVSLNKSRRIGLIWKASVF